MKKNSDTPTATDTSWKTKLLENANVDITFEVPDVKKLREARKSRNENLLDNITTSLDKTYAIVKGTKHSKYNTAALKIQKVFRGYLGRKKYFNALYAIVVDEEKDLMHQQEQQVQEGEIIIESYRIEQELKDEGVVSRNKSRLLHANAMLIQRAWRDHGHNHSHKKDHICCSCEDDYPDLYTYYKDTKTICFCCDIHKLEPDSEQLFSDDFSYDDEYHVEPLPYPTTDWLSIDNVLTQKQRKISDSSSQDMDDFRNKLSVDRDVKLTFVESYESDKNLPDVEVFNDGESFDSFDIIEAGVEKVTDFFINHSPDALEPVEESRRILKSLEIHEEHEKRKFSVMEESCSNFVSLNLKSIHELMRLISELNCEISVKNKELVEELMIRDELHTQHEALLMDADDLAKAT